MRYAYCGVLILTVLVIGSPLSAAERPAFITEHAGFVHVTTTGDCQRYEISRERQVIEVPHLNDRMLKYAWAGTPVYVSVRKTVDPIYTAATPYVVTTLRRRTQGPRDADAACTTTLSQSAVTGVLQAWSEGMHMGSLTIRLPTGNRMAFYFGAGRAPSIDRKPTFYCFNAPHEMCDGWPPYLHLGSSRVRVLFRSVTGPNGQTDIVPISVSTVR